MAGGYMGQILFDILPKIMAKGGELDAWQGKVKLVGGLTVAQVKREALD